MHPKVGLNETRSSSEQGKPKRYERQKMENERRNKAKNGGRKRRRLEIKRERK
jgi:hypothetical protein